ncbi:MAG: hypothetical protein Q8761_02900, partial [Sweet potato little leaf phytoplasma]|nr:hypothetical protein [Sweet potato little leaf phytoplasma]
MLSSSFQYFQGSDSAFPSEHKFSKANEDKIDKLQNEISEIVNEIGKIKVQIKNLETDQKYYQDIL